MGTVEVMQIVLLAVAAVACMAVVLAVREAIVTMRSLRQFAEETRQRLNPVLEKADVTVDAVNAELLRVDAIITRFEDASERVSSASGTISDIVNAPTDLVSNVASRVRRAWKSRHHEGPVRTTSHDDVSDTGSEDIHPAL